MEKLRDLIQDRPFKVDIDRLFKRIVIGCLIFGVVISIFQFAVGNSKELFSSVAFLLISILTFFIEKTKFKFLAYHILVIGIALLNVYMVIVLGSRYEAILLLFPSALIFCFIFMERITVIGIYMVFFCFIQFLIIYYNSGSDVNGISSQMIAEYISVVAFNVIFFFMCYFYLVNLKDTKNGLIEATNDVEFQREILKEKNNQLSKYIASNIQLENYTHLASHELKAPLRTMKGFVDILKRKLEGKLDVKEQEMFDFISTSSDKMSRMLDDLNALGRVSQTNPVMENVDTGELLEEINLERSIELQTSNGSLEVQGEFPEIQGQRGLLKQLFSNLIANGIKFTKEGVPPKIKISVEKKAEDYVFHFEDNGIGVEPENRDKIFQIFTRLHSEYEFEGSGIGLAICKKIVDLHRGSISVDESSMNGSKFSVRLPRKYPKY